MDNKRHGTFATFIIAVFALIIVIVLLNFENNKQGVHVLTISPSKYPDYEAIKGNKNDPEIKQLIIAKDYKNEKPASVNFCGNKKRYKVKGALSRAYLYIEAVVDYKNPLTVWDDIYFKINEQGGHLISDSNALPVPPDDSSKYLYDLRSISYFPAINEKKKVNVNFLELFKDGENINIITSISSNRPGRVLKEVSIYYKCTEKTVCSIQE